jgi:PAS domain S-box-containing protein
MEQWIWLQWATTTLIAASCVAVALVTFRTLKTQRRSTAKTVLTLSGTLILFAGIADLLETTLSRPPLLWLKPPVMLACALGTSVVSIALVRLMPRAAAFQNREQLQAASRELRQSKERFQRAIDGSFSGLWEWNLEQDSVWHSSRFRELLGYSTESGFPNTFESWKAALHPTDIEPVFEAIDTHLQDQSSFDVEYRLRTKSGEYRWFNARGLAIRDSAGRPYIMSGSIQDIHDRKQAEEDLRRSDEYLVQKQKMESLGELAGGTAHEFNNLLQAISGQIHFAARSLSDHSPAKQDLAIALDLIDQSAQFTRRLLDFSRRRPKVLASVNPNEIANELTTVLRPMLGAQIQLRLRLDERVCPVLADANTLKQALLNLCINARDAMLPNGGKLVLRTCSANMGQQELAKFPDAKSGVYTMLSVSDTGAGMAPNVEQKIFEPFFTTKAIGKGTGLGLAVVYNVVKEYGGIIDVESALGHGSTFTIWLPVTEQTASRQIRSTPASTATEKHRSATLLYAEDDDCIRRATAHMLEEHGHRVWAARDGNEALELFSRHGTDIDLALLDIVMPQLRGDEVLERLRDQSPTLPVVFCSGYASPLVSQDALSQGNTWLINKPFKADELLQLLEGALVANSHEPHAIG